MNSTRCSGTKIPIWFYVEFYVLCFAITQHQHRPTTNKKTEKPTPAMTFRRTLSSSSSSSSVAGEARAHPRRRLEDDPQESPALPDPATALLSLAAPRHLCAPLRVNRGGRVQSAAQGLPLHHLPDGREVHEVLQGVSPARLRAGTH